jgi:CelD/BcsL family acetyltransferase involved in cellulose biosynthesis
VHAVPRATPLTAFRTLPADFGAAAVAPRSDSSRQFAAGLTLSIHHDLASVESQWRRFETVAACTAFQTFDWLAGWQRNIGRRDGTIPVIVVGCYADDEAAFILPLAVEPHRLARRLCWLGRELCDYNAPLLARDFAQRVTPDRFVALWRELCRRLQRDARLHYDWIELEKMPETVGDLVNPFCHLDVMLNASGAHLVQLGNDWESFYFNKRSSATRRRDRVKRSRMAAAGEVRFVTSRGLDDTRRTLETLMEQKSHAFARGGIPNMFARPGYREFFLDFVSNPKTKSLVHVSRVEIGENCAAANFGLMFGDRYYHVLASYDRNLEVSRFGPGVLHLRELMAHAIKKGLRLFDFTIGDEPYKLEWSDMHVALFDYIAAATWRGRAAAYGSTTRRRLKRFIKQTPLAWRLAGSFRAAFGASPDRHAD